ncbi:hypothetical protein JCM10213_004647 [Rhodosporidiobolus nylandii]
MDEHDGKGDTEDRYEDSEHVRTSPNSSYGKLLSSWNGRDEEEESASLRPVQAPIRQHASPLRVDVYLKQARTLGFLARQAFAPTLPSAPVSITALNRPAIIRVWAEFLLEQLDSGTTPMSEKVAEIVGSLSIGLGYAGLVFAN